MALKTVTDPARLNFPTRFCHYGSRRSLISENKDESLTKFYTFYEEHIAHLKNVMNRESAIQLVYQLCMRYYLISEVNFNIT